MIVLGLNVYCYIHSFRSVLNTAFIGIYYKQGYPSPLHPNSFLNYVAKRKITTARRYLKHKHSLILEVKAFEQTATTASQLTMF